MSITEREYTDDPRLFLSRFYDDINPSTVQLRTRHVEKVDAETDRQMARAAKARQLALFTSRYGPSIKQIGDGVCDQ